MRTPNFTYSKLARAIKGVDGWKRIGPGLMIIPPLRKEPKLSMNLTHPVDKLGLYTVVEEADFDHMASLKEYTDLVTS